MQFPLLVQGPWKLKDYPVPAKGPTVFSCFCGGGGSSMGYRLAGFRSVGSCDLDKDMAGVYAANLGKAPILGKVKDLAGIPGPKDLDVLDGSPPCSVFSMSGKREADWGKKRKFKEGQAEQVLDDLFFDFVAVAKVWRPKVVIAENVKGMLIKNARGYVLEIVKALDQAGYKTQVFLLNASRMGVPQMRERVFFISRLKGKKLDLDFREPIIKSGQAFKGIDHTGEKLRAGALRRWGRSQENGRALVARTGNSFGYAKKLQADQLAPTVQAGGGLWDWWTPTKISRAGLIRLQTFPEDYNFLKMDHQYVLGMSVPPLMMQRLALEVRRQWLG